MIPLPTPPPHCSPFNSWTYSKRKKKTHCLSMILTSTKNNRRHSNPSLINLRLGIGQKLALRARRARFQRRLRGLDMNKLYIFTRFTRIGWKFDCMRERKMYLTGPRLHMNSHSFSLSYVQMEHGLNYSRTDGLPSSMHRLVLYINPQFDK